jgi:membrane protease YdiL (CAAX protease family)
LSDAPSSFLPADRLNSRDFRVLILWILAGVVGAAVAYKYFFDAFPEASVDFKVSRSQALDEARGSLTAQGHHLEGYKSSIIFEVDDDTKTYLERELGLARANQLMASEVSTWYWGVRFFRPQQKEEYSVRVSPAGRVVGMSHEIEEKRAGASLEQTAALAIATRYLEQNLHANLADYDYLPAEANKTERPARRDWSFTWERRGFKAKDAPYRLHVRLLGDQVGGYREFLKVPEAWQRDFQKLRSSNLLYQSFDQLFYFVLLGGAIWFCYDLGKRGLLNWRGALKLTLFTGGLYFLMSANQLPLLRSQYDTNSSYAGFFVAQIALAIFVSLLLGLQVGVSVGAGEPLYRKDQPEQVQLNRAFTLPGIRTKEFFKSSIIGLCLAGAHLGFVVLFYMIGYKHGIWAPQDINYTNVVSTVAPWLFPLTIGVYAATSEEFLFRLFAIPFLLRVTKSRFLAVVLPAFIWGFLHSVYPQEPGYVRGIEVGAIGIVAGIVMLRWGILATLVWHYTVDALLISMILLRSGSLYFRVSGAIVGAGALIPLGIAVVSYLSRRGFVADESLLNRAAPLVEKAPEVAAEAAPAVSAGYQALSARTLGIVLAAGALGVILFATTKTPAIGDFVRFSVTAKEAQAKADDALRQRSPAAAQAPNWHHSVTLAPITDPVVNEYLRRQVGIAGANDIYRNQVPPIFWRVRYFRDSEKEEYAVVLRPDGAVHAIHHQLAENSPGANLTKEEAEARAEAYLRDEKKLTLAAWKLVDAKSEKHPARTDHDFVWEKLELIGTPPAGYPDGAHVRVELKVIGDEVAGFRTFVKIPDEWERKQNEDTFTSTVYSVGVIALVVAAGVLLLVIYFLNLKDPAAREIPWRRFAVWAVWGLLAMLIGSLNNLQTLFASYNTEWPLKTFVALLLISYVIISGVAYSGLLFVFGLARFFLAKAFGSEHLPGWRNMPADYYRQGLWLALGGTGILIGFWRAASLVQKTWPTFGRGLDAAVPGTLGFFLPASGAAGSAVLRSLFFCGLIGIVAGFVAKYARQRWMQAGLIVLGAVAMTGDWGSPADFAKNLILHFVFVTLVWFGVSRILRFNLLAYFLISAILVLLPSALQLLSQPNSFYRANGVATLAVLIALLAWPLIAAQRASAPSASS